MILVKARTMAIFFAKQGSAFDTAHRVWEKKTRRKASQMFYRGLT